MITPAGRAAYEKYTGESSGIYSFEQETPRELSAEFQSRLRADAKAWADWESRPPGYRRRAAHWVMSAKRDETRERRFASLLEDSALGRKVKPLR